MKITRQEAGLSAPHGGENGTAIPTGHSPAAHMPVLPLVPPGSLTGQALAPLRAAWLQRAPHLL